jgi:hypothetical protein
MLERSKAMVACFAALALSSLPSARIRLLFEELSEPPDALVWLRKVSSHHQPS